MRSAAYVEALDTVWPEGTITEFFMFHASLSLSVRVCAALDKSTQNPVVALIDVYSMV